MYITENMSFLRPGGSHKYEMRVDPLECPVWDISMSCLAVMNMTWHGNIILTQNFIQRILTHTQICSCMNSHLGSSVITTKINMVFLLKLQYYTYNLLYGYE